MARKLHALRAAPTDQRAGRRHHRAKTSGAWTYERLAPGTYLWTGPAGITTLVTPDDIHDL